VSGKQRASRPGRLAEVLEPGRSASRGTDRLILAILADAAHADGIVWWGQELIASEANCSVREVRRATEELERLVDVEIRWAQHGRSRIKVYRVVVGRFGERELEYSRLPFELDEPFSHPDILSARREALRANLAHDWRLVEGHATPGQIVRVNARPTPGHLRPCPADKPSGDRRTSWPSRARVGTMKP
jgi:hypothetical protein